MIEKFIKYIITFIGLSSGVALGLRLVDLLIENNIFNLDQMVYRILSPTIVGVLFAIISYFASQLIIRLGKKLAQITQAELEKIPQQDFIF
jgi:uncharacterized protein YacL